MSTIAIQPLTQAWGAVRSFVPLAPIRTESQYEDAVDTLRMLLELVGSNEQHPLYDLLDTFSILIEAYEESHYPAQTVTGRDALRFLLEEHRLTPTDMPELGDTKSVNELLAGQRELTIPEIRSLSARFGVSPATFF